MPQEVKLRDGRDMAQRETDRAKPSCNMAEADVYVPRGATANQKHHLAVHHSGGGGNKYGSDKKSEGPRHKGSL